MSVSAAEGVITHDLVGRRDCVGLTMTVALVPAIQAGVALTVEFDMSVSSRRWSWIAFFVGLIVGVPIGAVGLVVLAQVLTVMISLP